MPRQIDISVVAPVYNEEESLPALYEETRAALDGPAARGASWELVLVDDRSSDRSLEVMLELRARDRRVHIVRFKSNAGQTAAMGAGFECAHGDVVVTIDADLQNDPADIPRMVQALDSGSGFDQVSGGGQVMTFGLTLTLGLTQ